MLGMGALAVDVGMMYTAQTEVQVSADAAALAAANELSGPGDVQADAIDAANTYAALNKVMGMTPAVYPDDVEFGRAHLDTASGRYHFEPSTGNFDAVRITVRHVEPDIPGHEVGLNMPLAFANVFGFAETSLQARAAAVLVPRDIAVVIDLSNSMCYDSQIRYWNRDDGGYSNLRDVWAALDGPEPDRPYVPGPEIETQYAQDTGPVIGAMDTWGDPLIAGEYDPTTDPGLFYLPRGQDWSNNDALDQKLIDQGYDEWERWAILTNETQGYMTAPATDELGFTSRVVFKPYYTDSTDLITVFVTSDNSGATPALSHLTISLPSCARSKASSTAASQGGYPVEIVNPDPKTGFRGIKFDETALGEGGAVETEWFSFQVPHSCGVDDVDVACKAGPGSSDVHQNFGWPDPWNHSRWRYRVAAAMGMAQWDGDGDSLIQSNELSWTPKLHECWDWSWTTYIDYPRTTGNYSGQNSGFRYRYGLKTFTDYLMDRQPGAHQTCGLYATPEQPLRAVKDAVNLMIEELEALDSLDHASLQIFGKTTREEVDLTEDMFLVRDRLYEMQTGHYDRYTNLGGGLEQAINTFEKPDSLARPTAHKVIMLMSDGCPNVDAYGNVVGTGSYEATEYARQQAQLAADQDYRIYTVSVGYGADRALLQEIAEIGDGEEFYAAGDPATYAEQLQAIFHTLGGRRPVALIE